MIHKKREVYKFLNPHADPLIRHETPESPPGA